MFGLASLTTSPSALLASNGTYVASRGIAWALRVLRDVALGQLRLGCNSRVRLVGDLAAGTPNDVSSLLLLNLMQLLLAGLVNLADVFLELAQLLLERVEFASEVILALMVVVQLLVKEHNLLLIDDLLALIKRLLQHNPVAFVFQLAILLVVDD